VGITYALLLEKERSLLFERLQLLLILGRLRSHILLFLRGCTVLDFGRPSISGSIRSIKIYSWA
jgi:hypothetical protein